MQQQSRQTQFTGITERLEQTAVIQERILARLDSLERWRDEQDRRAERAEDRRDSRDDQRPQLTTGQIALVFSAVMALIYVLQFVSAHWK